jgi:hypothetical protein
MIPQIIYTNSNCSDIWEMFVTENQKNTNSDLYVICNNDDFPIMDKTKIFTYDNNSDYYLSWVSGLVKFNVKNFIYLQEDFVLYDKVNDEKILEICEILNNSDYSFIRLIKSGNLNDVKIFDNLYEIEPCNNDIFSMQPTIWKTDDYIKILNSVMEKKWFETTEYRNFMCINNIKGLYYYNGESKRGLNHYDSSIYPYIATALVRGRWNTKEYHNELLPLIEKYNININIRGQFI